MSKFLLSVGDSDKYAIQFDGDKKSLENSAYLKDLKDKINDFLKKEFPAGGFAAVDSIKVEEGEESAIYPPLDEDNFKALLHSAKRQVEVLNQTKEQNLNAPYDQD